MIHDSNDILEFWFGNDPSDMQLLQQRYERWFSANPTFDAEVRSRFGATAAAACSGDLSAWCGSAAGTLALILLLDQFPRNIYRGSARAFACDAHALDICRTGMAAGSDRTLAPIERVFFYMPLEHAEDLATQQASVRAFAQLCDEAPQTFAAFARKNHGFAVSHLKIIEQFGRFPHRNVVLGRRSTDAERAYLETTTNNFEQG